MKPQDKTTKEMKEFDKIEIGMFLAHISKGDCTLSDFVKYLNDRKALLLLEKHYSSIDRYGDHQMKKISDNEKILSLLMLTRSWILS